VTVPTPTTKNMVLLFFQKHDHIQHHHQSIISRSTTCQCTWLLLLLTT
jgi:hypothetical protein